MPSARAPRRRRLLALAGIAAALPVAAGLWLWPLAPPLLEITAPSADVTVGIEALEVVIRFPREDWVRHETFRARLNGADVTGSFETAPNGAYGRLVRLVDGENVLEIAVFGRTWWFADRLVEHTRVVGFRVRRRIDHHWG